MCAIFLIRNLTRQRLVGLTSLNTFSHQGDFVCYIWVWELSVIAAVSGWGFLKEGQYSQYQTQQLELHTP